MIDETELTDLLCANDRRAVPASGLSLLIGRMTPQELRPKVRVLATNAIAPIQRRKARRLSGGSSPSRVNVGCGALRLDGWINLDLVGLPVDIAWNILRPLPFDNSSVDVVFHEHVVEHVRGIAGFRFLKECHRVLRLGGVMRVVAPDASRYMESYFDPSHRFITEFRGARPTPMLALQEEFYGFGHRAVYDYETIALFCTVIGFSEIERKSFGQSAIDPCPDSEWREPDSFYAEAIK